MAQLALETPTQEIDRLKKRIRELERQIADSQSLDPRIRKIKVDYKNGKILVRYETPSYQGEEWDEGEINRKAEPRPQFWQALEALVPHVCVLCELPEDYSEEMTIIGVSISYSEDNVRSVTITAQKKLVTSTAPLILNTPNKPEKPYGGGEDDTNCFDLSLGQALNELEEEARRFLNGERAQLSLDSLE